MVISLKLLNHNRIYELTHIVKEAFPYGIISDENPDIVVTSRKEENKIITVIQKEDTYIEASFSYNEKENPVTREGHAVCISFLKCYKKFGTTPVPWGALIGIRPSKMVSNFKNAGYSFEEMLKILKEDYMISDEKIPLMLKTDKCEERLLSHIDKKSYSIYIGIPFCPTRCSYCSFISRTYKDEEILSLYVDCLIKELELLDILDNLKLNSIYIGGGTPTTLSPALLYKLTEAINKKIDITKVKEYTIEAGRPDTVTKEKLDIIKNSGAKRISINPQTLNDKTLKLIGRAHTKEQFFSAFELARKADFPVINTDLILGLPEEAEEDFKYTIDNIIKLKPENITLHTLAIKRAAHLNSSEYKPSPANEMHKIAEGKLKGYIPYYLYRQKNTVDNLENTGYALPGTECIYNMCMMGDTETVISFGGGAVTKFIENANVLRIRNPKDADLYIKTIDDVIKGKEQKFVKYNLSRGN